MESLLEKDENIKTEFKKKEIDPVDFAKKTMGQIVFLYFLQKKGWFGVPPDKEWGQGRKNFLRELFERREKYGKNFFNDVLEPLFYEALAQDRGKASIYPKLNNCKMPFLNGGLFEPMNEYLWETTNINIPDEVFSNDIPTKEGDRGNGILDVFDRYNFTVNENEPLEKEVAVDPEMLGKVFENLLQIKDRKSKGAFYTPREIVHYMCQECLINYLHSESSDIPQKDIENFIHTGDRIIENDAITFKKIKDKEKRGYKYSGNYKLLLSDSIIERAQELDELLRNIKVADPAVGSGAFPLGMINEIVRARKILNIYLDKDISDYQLKKHAISHSIYGVDIDSGAVEIAKLRLWLTLIVDETTPSPLPNLDHKIMQGNSLISEYEGIKLFDDSLFEDIKLENNEKDSILKTIPILEKEYIKKDQRNELSSVRKVEILSEIRVLQKRLKSLEADKLVKSGSLSLFDSSEKTKLVEKSDLLQKKIKEYVFESRRTQKEQLKHEIDDLKWDLIEASFEEQGKQIKLKEVKKLRHKNIKPFFVWKLEFSDVFKENGGFDVVIGNPPYVSAIKHSNVAERKYLRDIYPEVRGAFDLYTIFLLLGLNILKKDGVYSWIIPNKFLISDYSKNVLSKLKSFGLHKSIDVSKYNTFHNVGVYPIIIFGEKITKKPYYHFEIQELADLQKNKLTKFKEVFSYKTLKDFGIKIGSGTTGFQAKTIIPLIKNGSNSDSNSIPFAVSGSIDPYLVDNSTVRYMKHKYSSPEICFDPKILAKSKWKFWNNPKIVIAGMTKRIEAFFIESPLAIGVGCYAIYDFGNFDPKFLLGLLNSKFMTYFLNKKFKDKHLAGGYLAINKSTIEQLPLVVASNMEQIAIINLVIQIQQLALKGSYSIKDPSEKQIQIEKQINVIVYKLYDVGDDDIISIEES